MKLLIAVTADISVRLLQGQLEYLSQKGFEVHLVVSKGAYSEKLQENQQLTIHYIEMAREISLTQDFLALIQMIRVFREVRPDISNVGTPKAALLGSIAAFLTRTKRRIYTLRGLRLETTKGLKRVILKWMEQLTILLSTDVIAISPSLIEKCRWVGLKGTKKMVVLGEGSSNGLNVAAFDALCLEDVAPSFTKDKFVIGFTGRITKDKGIEELVAAFKSLPNCQLLLVGGLEENNDLNYETMREIDENPNIFVTGFISNPAPYYRYMDVFVIPSYREGFSNVCLEAAAAKLPIIGTNVTGIKDAIVHEETGCLVVSHSSAALKDAIVDLKQEPLLREVYGENGRKRVLQQFQSEKLWEKMVDFYQKGDVRNV